MNSNILSSTEQYWFLQEFAATSSIDLLILENTGKSEKDFWWPVLAVEIDGPYHEKEEQLFRDFKKDKICDEALLPLLRIKLTRQCRHEIV